MTDSDSSLTGSVISSSALFWVVSVAASRRDEDGSYSGQKEVGLGTGREMESEDKH